MGHNYPSGILTSVTYESGSLITSTKYYWTWRSGDIGCQQITPTQNIVINDYSAAFFFQTNKIEFDGEEKREKK